MAARVLPVALVLAAIAGDERGLHEPAFYLLVAAVAAAAVSALSLFGRLVELPAGAPGRWTARADAVLGALGLVCVLVAAGARGQVPDASAIPALAAAAAVAALAVYGAQTLTALAFAPGARET